MRRRIFEPSEANRAIPLVARIVEDIVREYRELSALAEEYRTLRSADDRTGDGQTRLNDLKGGMAARTEVIDEFVRELQEIGCEMKDLGLGVVDFPSVLDGRTVSLCWRLGEERVEHWHELTEGFEDRRPLPVPVLEE
jgi:hypothetical protein